MTDELTNPSPNRTRRREYVTWLCVHWTGGTFGSAVDWCTRPESEVSYHTIISPEGKIARLVPYDFAAWAVGYSKSPLPNLTFRSGNHSSESIALAGGPPGEPTAAQRKALLGILAERMRAHGWGPGEVWRILGHDQVAIYGPDHPDATKRGKFGRKPDPQGTDRWGKPIGGWLPLDGVRRAVADLLAPPSHARSPWQLTGARVTDLFQRAAVAVRALG